MDSRADYENKYQRISRKVCSDCIGDEYLNKVVNRYGEVGLCHYCENVSKAIKIESLAKFVNRFFEDHFVRITQDDLSHLQIGYADEPEPNVSNIIEEYAEVDIEIADDLFIALEVMPSETDDPSYWEDNPFDELAHYEIREIYSDYWSSLWNELNRTILEDNRMFNRKAKEILDLIFANTIKIRYHQDGDMPAIVEVGPDKPISSIFRAREFQSDKDLHAALQYPDREIGPPPSPIAPANRMNAKGISMFYGAAESDVAVAEIRPSVGSKVVVAEFDIIRDLKLLDIVKLQSIIAVGSMFRPSQRRSLEKMTFISYICRKISAPVMPVDQPVEYVITQTISDYLSELTIPTSIDGIIYQSAQKGDASTNIALFHKASRVELRNTPKETRIYQGPEDPSYPDSKIEYNISETLSGKDEEKIDYASDIDNRKHREDDKRIPSLSLNFASISVYVIDSVNFGFHQRKVHRYQK